ncbi:EAL domain-containing protein [Rubellimicrobium rubrum]|uniref:EAL domain-containing protein n=2 Tax=Rubellimicrobium rubrum TaxID=2585369 RepID=A0A5C4MUC2_9RHOB|nr:EAL domain-containing protein [Rubellimicrobium rubrum]
MMGCCTHVGRSSMQMAKRILGWLTLRSVDPDLAVAQYRQVQRQIPMLYALLSVNAVAVAYTHLGVAPGWMTIWVPAVLVTVSLVRLVTWTRRPQHVADAGQALHMLRRTTVLGSVLAIAYIAWSLALNGYGNDREHAHVAIFIAVTVIGCIFCLMHLPQAALAITTIVTVSFLVYYLSSGDRIYTAIGLNILLVTLVMIRVLLNSFRGFDQLIRTQGETTRLNRDVTLLAHTDMLTGLPNRRLFFSELDEEVATCRTQGRELALGLIDLDRFKAANDTFGHLLGDQLLEAVGQRLRDVFNSDCLVARLGGDEFGFLLESDGAAACDLGVRACDALSRPFRLGDITVSIGASCGIATTRDVSGTAMSLYDAADYALYNAKSEHRGVSVLYSAKHERRIRSERAVEAALQAADLDAEMDVHFQPIVHVERGTVLAAEALARWTSPQIGQVRPDVFIALAERAGIIHRITLMLLEKALASLERLPSGILLSFNLSAHDLASEEAVTGLAAVIQRSGVEPSRLVFELTETAVLRDFPAAEHGMRRLRALGARIALDDFGTGQSGLSYLHRLPIDKVKIDRSFVSGASEPSGRELLSAVVALCRSLRLECIAEGVEDQQQLRHLREIGCDAFQGYLFAKPMPAEELTARFGSAEHARELVHQELLRA